VHTNDTEFEWDGRKDLINQEKHGYSFEVAKEVFLDPNRFTTRDHKHSSAEERFFCYGKVRGEILTVRFTFRGERVRIIGAGKWAIGEQTYEEKNQCRV
jgi:uncharacterized DUF497 family protein